MLLFKAGYRGKHKAGQHRRRPAERFQRPGAGCLPAAKLLADLVAERTFRGVAVPQAEQTTVIPVAVFSAMVRPYILAGAR